MQKMSVIYVEKTGHVLGAFTRTADAESEPPAEDVAGAALLLRDPDTGRQMFSVGSQHLKVKNVDRNDDVIVSHQSYVLEDDVPAEKPELTFASAFGYTRPTLTVTVTAAPAEDVKAFVQFEDGMNDPIVVWVDILSGATSGDATVTLAPGTYDILMLVPGYRTLVDSDTL